jgi:IS30 family transposase
MELQKMVARKLILDWSPEQISGWLKIEYPDDESMRVSHETIYRLTTCHTTFSVISVPQIVPILG